MSKTASSQAPASGATNHATCSDSPVLAIHDLHVQLPADADRPDAVAGVSINVGRGEIV